MIEINKDNEQILAKNHYVPKGYLRNWCHSDNKLWVYRSLVSNADVPLWKRATPSAIAYHFHLYTKLGDKNLDDEVEKWFDRDFESPAQGAINCVLDNLKLSPEDWNNLVRFVALQDARTPSRLRDHMERAPRKLSEVLSELAEEIPHKLSDLKPKDRKGIKNNNLLPLRFTPIKEHDGTFINIESYVGRSTWLFSLRYILTDTIRVLYKHKWTIIRPYKGMKWFTSDNPVIRLNFTNHDKYDLNGGWDVKQGNILLPLSPEHLLLTQMGCRPPIKGFRFDKDLTVFIRKIIAENAYRMIFSSEPDSEIIKLSPRKVDAKLFKQEKDMWNEWHDKNLLMEKEFKQ